MSGKRYSEEPIVRILGEIQGGRTVAATAREYAISRWRKKFGGIALSEVRRLQELEAENARLRRIVAQQAMGNDTLRQGPNPPVRLRADLDHSREPLGESVHRELHRETP